MTRKLPVLGMYMSDIAIVELPENLTIASVETLHEQLEPLLNAGNDVMLKAAGVTRVDTAGLQTLLAFHKALVTRSLRLSWSAPSQPLLETAEQLGLREALSFN